MPLLRCLMLALACLGLSAQAGTLLEAEARSRVVAMLGKFVTWPPHPELSPTRPFVVGVLGAHPFEDALDRHTKNLRIQGRPVELRYLTKYDQGALLACDILYIAGSEDERLPAIVAAVAGRPILLVGGSPGMARRGIMLNLLIKDGYLAPEVNLRETRRAGLEILPVFLDKTRAKVVE